MNLKKKTIFLSLLLGIIAIAPIKVKAAALLIDGSSSGSTGTYTIKYSKSATDTETTMSFDVSNSKNNVTTSLTTNLANSNCSGTSCNITLPEGNGTSFTVATIILKNETELDILNNTLSVVMNGITTSKDGINLNAGKIVQTKNSESTLSGITLSAGTMGPSFNSATLAYTITGIKDTINSVLVTPQCTNNCSWALSCPTGECSVSNSKKVTLQTGANTLNINVTSEDKTSNKTYVLTIYRGEIETASAYLSSLKIQGIKISPAFDSLTNDYTATVAYDIKDINITTISEDPEAKVEIKGNKDLKVGENTVTITVTSSDELNKQIYTIKVTKEEESTTTKLATTKIEKKKDYTILIIVLSILVVVIIIGIYLFIKNKKKKKNNNNDKNNKINIKRQEEKEIETEVIDDTSGDLLDELGYEENIELPKVEEKPDYLDEENPKTDVDNALDDLMQTKKIELGDLNF